MVKAKVTIKNTSGLHLRPAGILCNEAVKYQSQITFSHKNNVSNAKSVLSVLGAASNAGMSWSSYVRGRMKKRRCPLC